MITIGKMYTLDVVKAVDFGFYLNALELGEVLLPLKYAPRNLSVGDSLTVFLYRDSEGRPVATTQTPKAQVGEFALLKVVASTSVGAFLDWGLDKHVLAPFAEQYGPMEVGQSYLVYLYLDKLKGRITASSKIDKFLSEDNSHAFKLQQEVNLIIANSTELGIKAIINHSHWGVLYKNEVHKPIRFGQQVKGYIKKVRPDGKIDLTLQSPQQSHDNYERMIEDYIKSQNGFAPLNDKSDPQLIAELFGISKAAFKKSIGHLYKQRIITIKKDGIRLVKNDEMQKS